MAQVLPLYPLRPWEPTRRALGAVEGWRPRSCVWPWAPGGIIPFEQNSQESKVGGRDQTASLAEAMQMWVLAAYSCETPRR